MVAAVLFSGASVHAGVEPCSLLKAEEVSRVMGGAIKGNQLGPACYFIGLGKEVLVAPLDKSGYQDRRQFVTGPISQKLGWRKESLPNVGSEVFVWHDKDQSKVHVLFQKGAGGGELEVKGATDLKAAAEALAALAAQRVP